MEDTRMDIGIYYG